MNIKGLRAFTKIMAMGTLSAAAKSMNISESALSRQLSLLEAELGLVLFSREKRRLIPLPDGEVFYREAERILTSIEQIPEIVRDIKNGTQMRMRIIAMPRMASSIAAPAIAKFLEEQPDKEVAIEVQPRRLLERWVASRKYDLGLGALPAHHSGIQTEKLYSVPVVAVLHPDHPFATRTSLRVEDLAGERFISMAPDTLLGQQVKTILGNAGITPKSPIQSSQAQLCCKFVAQGLGVAITDAMIADTFGSEVKMVPITPHIHLDFGLLYPTGVNRSKEAQRLVEIIKIQAKSIVANLSFS